ncbi:GtrA family protein [Rhodopseudomonas palustris]|uniref:GtrA family protein n=1 Tax=Rhodopseudomonas palustris TaxID=1076 RepID=UPI002ACD8125|nr:GtrA family protein [Rhodopseudomonas palustris]WQH00468.1 GtrA family protein [Rhodopseudomonas palustris]
MEASTKLAISYAIFAVMATAINIAAQDAVVRLFEGAIAVAASVVVGTAAGLMAKYLLDKRYIFRFRTRGAADDARIFALYSAMGVATTLVFWLVEFGFHVAFGSKEMRYVGGVIGLAIGYIAKYHLDKRFVFRAEAP